LWYDGNQRYSPVFSRAASSVSQLLVTHLKSLGYYQIANDCIEKKKNRQRSYRKRYIFFSQQKNYYRKTGCRGAYFSPLICTPSAGGSLVKVKSVSTRNTFLMCRVGRSVRFFPVLKTIESVQAGPRKTNPHRKKKPLLIGEKTAFNCVYGAFPVTCHTFYTSNACLVATL